MAVGGNLVNKKVVANGDLARIIAEAWRLMETVRSAAV